MNLFWAILMGLLQGITEFFPVSSSAHLTLFPWIFNFPDPGLAFDIALHAGTLVAILIALWPDWSKLTRGIIKRQRESLNLLILLLATSVPAALFGVMLEDKAKTIFRTPLLIAFNLIFFGIVLWSVDKYLIEKKDITNMKWPDGLLIGIAQALAIIPGVSRSGATITAGRALKLKREAAVKYSFMAALPVIAGATVFGLRNIPAGEILAATWVCGFLAAIVSSVWAMKFLLRYVKTNNFNLFVWWRFGLALFIIFLYLWR